MALTVVEGVTIFAIIIGPVLAVLISRLTDDRSKARHRRIDIFRSLMKTRKNILNVEHVHALNIVELEFHGEDEVKTCLRAYIDFRTSALPSGESDGIRHADRADDLLYDLIQAIGKTINYKFDKNDLKRFSYSPQGWSDDNYLLRKNAEHINLLLTGRIPLPVKVLPPEQNSAFPPVPEQPAPIATKAT